MRHWGIFMGERAEPESIVFMEVRDSIVSRNCDKRYGFRSLFLGCETVSRLAAKYIPSLEASQ